jgi:hypothetical protein
MRNRAVWLLGAVFLTTACEKQQEITVFSINYDFSLEDNGWTGDFSNYPEGDSLNYQLVFKHDTLPTNLNQNATKKALLVSGENGSVDLFMFVKKKLSGLRPNTIYNILFNVRFASSAPTGLAGGAPGENVFLKAGATQVEPNKFLEDGLYRMNIDKGEKAESGEDMMLLGNIGVAANTTQYTPIARSNNSKTGFLITTNSQGELWLVVGADSAYAGKTTLYYTQIDVLFNQME